MLSTFEDPATWIPTGENVDMDRTDVSVSNLSSEGDGSLQLDYVFTYDPSVLNQVVLVTNLPISGVPDSLYLDVKSDGERHRIFYQVEDAQGRTFEFPALAYADSDDVFATLPAAFSRAQGVFPSWTMYHPVSLTGIRIRLASDRQEGWEYAGTMYLDNLRITYPATSTATEAVTESPDRVALEANYPNPFRGVTTITYSLPSPEEVRLAIFDVLGRQVMVVESGLRRAGTHTVFFDAGELGAGTYFYRLKTGDRMQVGQMTVVR